MEIVADAAASRRWWLAGLLLLLAGLNLMAWTGWRPRWLGRSDAKLDFDSEAFGRRSFEWSEEDFERLANGQVPVLVVDGHSDSPWAGAAVWMSEPGWFNMVSEWRDGLDLLADAPPDHSVRTDERGIAWIPEPRDHGHVLASAGGLGGWCTFMPGKPLDALARCGQIALVCAIYGGKELRVERPADAEGTALPVFLRDEEFSGRKPLHLLPGGSVEIVKWDALLDLNWTGETDDPPLHLVPGFCDEAAIPLTQSMLRKGRATLRAPPTGQILVQLLDRLGDPLEPRTAVFLGEAGQPWSNRPMPAEAQMAGVAETGTVLLRGVPLGKRWNLGYRLPRVLGKVTIAVAGPTRAGETVTVSLDPRPEIRPLSVKLHHVNASEAGDCDFWVTLKGQDGAEDLFDSGLFRNGADGTLDCSYASPASGAWQSVTYHFLGDADHPGFSTDALPVPGSGLLGRPAARVSEDLRAWGEVEDAEGGEVPRAQVGIESWLDTAVAPDGSFQFHEPALEAQTPFDLIAAGPWHLPQRLLCADRDVKLRFKLQRASRVHGRLLLPDSMRPYPLRIECVGARSLGDDLEAARSSFDVSSKQGWFDCGPLPEGTWDLRLTIGGIVVAEVPAVRLVAGELCRDPRLAAIDLRDRRATHVAVERKKGRGAPALERFYLMVELRDGSRLMANAGGLLLPPDAVRVGAAAPGFREEWQPVRESGSIFKLEPE